jgi:phosphoribosyl-AMP cyclohydrolase
LPASSLSRQSDGLTSARNWLHVKQAPAASRRAFFFIGWEHNMNLDFKKTDGLLPAIIQDWTSGRVLMLGFMNQESFEKTVATGFVTFYSRSRQKLWMKGESSGHRLVVREIATDCDLDSLLIRVDALGPGVCHNGFESCFYRRLENSEWRQIESPKFNPKEVYGGQQ